MANLAVADTWPVEEGAVGITIPGVYPLPYQVKATPSWMTDVNTADKGALAYTLQFTVAAPPDAFVDVLVVNE